MTDLKAGVSAYDPLVVPRTAVHTHIAMCSWRVGTFVFFEAAPKPLPTLKRVYFVAYRGEWISRESYDTLEDAMIAAAEFAKARNRS